MAKKQSALLREVLQGSLLGPTLFIIFLNNLFQFFRCYGYDFADDTTPYICDKNLVFLICAIIAIKWLENNYIKMNSNKCHLIISGNKFGDLWANVGSNRKWKTRAVKLLGGITIDNELKFDEHLSTVCLNTKRKLIESESILRDFLNSYSNTVSLSAYFYSRSTDSRANHLRERALRLVYDDYELTFEELLKKDESSLFITTIFRC